MLAKNACTNPAKKVGIRGLVMHRRIAAGVAMLAIAAGAYAQDQGVPFKMQSVDEQVVNGVRIRGARMPVWTDPNGRPSGRPVASTPNQVDQDELNELARIGRPDQRYAPEVPPQVANVRRAPAQAQGAVQQPAFERVAMTAPVPNSSAGSPSLVPAAKVATIHRRARTEDEELADLERALESAQSDLRVKKNQIEERKKDEARRAEEARVAAEREALRQRLVFQAQKGQMLSEAISAFVGQNGWENVEWNVGTDFHLKYAYSERPAGNEGMKEVLLRVLAPFGLSAELHRPNSVVEIYPATESASRN